MRPPATCKPDPRRLFPYCAQHRIVDGERK
jgi:hypothetical protein